MVVGGGGRRERERESGGGGGGGRDRSLNSRGSELHTAASRPTPRVDVLV